jgi:hypothetical protein
VALLQPASNAAVGGAGAAVLALKLYVPSRHCAVAPVDVADVVEADIVRTVVAVVARVCGIAL